MDFPFIYVSAGQRGLQLKVSPSELIDYCKGKVADVAVDKWLRHLTFKTQHLTLISDEYNR